MSKNKSWTSTITYSVFDMGRECESKKQKGGSMSKLLEAVKEASISVACLLDDIAVENNDIKVFELQKDIEHLQDQITIIENNLKEIT